MYFNTRAQLAYIEQLQGRTDAALVCYNQVLKNKPNNIALTAVISTNIVAAHKVSFFSELTNTCSELTTKTPEQIEILFEVNSKDTRMMRMLLFRCIYG